MNQRNYPIIYSQYDENCQGGDRKKIVCYAGDLIEGRNIELLVQSAAKLNGHLYLAGPISKQYRQMLETKYQDTYQVNWFYLGMLSRQEILDLYSESTIGLCLYKKERNTEQSLPNKIFEYMEAGLAVIASDFSMWREIIDGEECGICVDETSGRSICNAVNYLFEHSEIAIKMGENGRRAVMRKYNWKGEEKKLLATYAKLM